MVVTFAVFEVYGACVRAARDHGITQPKVILWLKRSFAAAFVLFGVRIAFGRQ